MKKFLLLIIIMLLRIATGIHKPEQKRTCWGKNRFLLMPIMVYKQCQGIGKLPGQRGNDKVLSRLCKGICHGKAGSSPCK